MFVVKTAPSYAAAVAAAAAVRCGHPWGLYPLARTLAGSATRDTFGNAAVIPNLPGHPHRQNHNHPRCPLQQIKKCLHRGFASMPADGKGRLSIPSAPTWSVSALFKKGKAEGADGGGEDIAQAESSGAGACDVDDKGRTPKEVANPEVTPADVVRLGKLAHLPVSEEAAEAHRHDLAQLLNFARQVQAVETAGVEPLHSVLDMPMPLRADEAKEGCDILGNAPQQFERFFVAPKEKHFGELD
jgi:aspartyl-tRNA(Asn)/glutamyl-tRNA(Gln) amidotransferase subunit C